MATKLTLKANELSTYVVTVEFLDENDQAVIPTALTWTLSDRMGNVINSRQDVSIFDLSAAVDIVLSGNDLKVLPATIGETRTLTIKATYDSSSGSNLPLNDEVEFAVKNLQKVAALG